MLSVEQIDQLSYNDLRKLAKLYRIKSNQKAVKLRLELKKVVETSDLDEEKCASAVVCEEGVNKLTKPANDLCIQTPVSNSRSPSVRLSATTLSSGGGLAHSSEVHSANTTGVFIGREADHVCSLNETYEVAEPLFAKPEFDVGTHLPEETATFPNSLVVTSQIPEAPGTTNNNNRQLKFNNPKMSSAISRVRPVPNFKRIHAQAAAKMESLPQYLERRCQTRNGTRPPFASPIFRGCMGSMRKGNLKNTINTCTPVPLSDMTNSNYCLAKASLPRGFSLVESRKLSGFQSSGQVKPTFPVKRSASNLQADTAFARRKAYDTHRRLSTTPARKTTAPQSTTVRDSLSKNSKNPADPPHPRVISFRAHVALQKQKAATSAQINRFIMKHALVDTNRGIRR